MISDLRRMIGTRLAAVPVLLLLAGCDAAAADQGNNWAIAEENMIAYDEYEDTFTPIDNGLPDANIAAMDAEITAHSQRIDAATAGVSAAWREYLRCLNSAISAFSRNQEPATDVVRGAIGLCSSGRSRLVEAIEARRQAFGDRDFVRGAELEAAQREAGLSDELLGEVMAIRFQRSVGRNPPPRR